MMKSTVLTIKIIKAFTAKSTNTETITKEVSLPISALRRVLPKPGNPKIISAIVTLPIIAGTLPAR
jgi:hypothetical protein